jgi:hypothetical protein
LRCCGFLSFRDRSPSGRGVAFLDSRLVEVVVAGTRIAYGPIAPADVPGLLAAGWVHYLAFDLFVGAWIAERGAALGLPHWQLVPVLLLTFMFGPAGLLAFILLRALRRPASLRWRAEGAT